MKKTLTTLSAVALILSVAGCSTEDGGTSSSAPASSASPASPSRESGPADTPSPTASPVALAEGFPSTLIPVLEDADVESSTVDQSGDTLTAVLVESSGAPAGAILAFYDAALVAQGFSAAPPAAGAPVSRDYIRAGAGEPETVNITVITRKGSPSTVTVGAALRAESAK